MEVSHKDVVPDYLNTVVSIRPALLVPEPHSMGQLMSNSAHEHAAVIDANTLPASCSTDCCKAPGMCKILSLPSK